MDSLDNLKVSVVIRAGGTDVLLPQVIRHVQEQSWNKIDEILVVDCGLSKDVLSEVYNDFKAIRIIAYDIISFSHGHSLNIGMSEAHGDVVVILSGHAIPANSDWLEKLIHHFDTEATAAVASKLISMPRSAFHNHLLNLSFYLFHKPLKNRVHLIRNTSIAIRKTAWQKIKFNEALPACEDRVWLREVIGLGLSAYYEPDSVVFHSHDESWLTFWKRIAVLFIVRSRVDLEKLLGTAHTIGLRHPPVHESLPAQTISAVEHNDGRTQHRPPHTQGKPL